MPTKLRSRRPFFYRYPRRVLVAMGSPAVVAPVVEATQVTTVGVASTSHVIDLSSLGAGDGDRIFVVAATGRNNLSPGTTWPGGWGELSDTTNVSSPNITLSSAELEVSGSAPSDVTITTVNNTFCVGVALRISGHDSAVPTEVVTAVDTADPSAITPSWGPLASLFGAALGCDADFFPAGTFPYPDNQVGNFADHVHLAVCTDEITGTTVDPASWASLESGFNVLTFAMKGLPPAGGISQSVGQVVETETALPITATKIRTVGQVVETETSQLIRAVRVVPVGQVTEVETATAVSRLKSRVVPQVTEVETSGAVSRLKIRAVGQTTEIESAQAIARLRSRVLGQVTEIETAHPVARSKIRTVAQVLETESALTVGRTKFRIVAQVLEVETAQSIILQAGGIVNQVIETEIALPIRAVKIRTVNTVVENELVLPVTGLKRRTVGQVTEVETAHPLTRSKLRLVGQVLELESASPVTSTKLLVVGQVVEIETALAILTGPLVLVHTLEVGDLERRWLAVPVLRRYSTGDVRRRYGFTDFEGVQDGDG